MSSSLCWFNSFEADSKTVLEFWKFRLGSLDPQLGYESKNRTLRPSQLEKALCWTQLGGFTNNLPLVSKYSYCVQVNKYEKLKNTIAFYQHLPLIHSMHTLVSS